jgi:tRNA(Ile)-lysidine synthase
LHSLREDLDLQLHGAHLNHGLRGDAAEEDAEFVSETFARLDIPLSLEVADVPAFRKEHRLSLEEAARKVRYGFLSRVAAEQGTDAIALGHTADDQAETVLMHVIRGSGLMGLRGMEPVSRRAFNGRDAVLVRPLLRVSRQITAEYCRVLKLEPRRDESNLSTELKRNRVRLELLPILEEYNPRIRDALVRLSRSSARDMAYLESETDRAWQRAARSDGRGVSLDNAAFSRLAPSIQAHLLRRALMSVRGDLEDVEQCHIDDMTRLITAGDAGRSLDLPGGFRFATGYGEATLASSEHDLCPLPPMEGEHSLTVPGDTLLPGWRITATLRSRPQPDSDSRTPSHGEANTVRQDHTAQFDYGELGSRLWVRSRVPGERFQPLGMARVKRLQDFMVDSKIPRGWRDRVPLVVSSRGIAWVVGWRIAEWAKVLDRDERQLELRFVPR